MGSSERTRRLLDGLPEYPHLHSPVGLSIGADGPDEIAISIAAELIAVKRGKQQRSREVASHGHRRTGTCSRKSSRMGSDKLSMRLHAVEEEATSDPIQSSEESIFHSDDWCSENEQCYRRWAGAIRAATG